MRPTGKTFRAVLRAVADASDGRTVILVSKYPHSTRPQAYASAMVQPLHDCAWFSYAGRELDIRPAGGETVGRVKFTSAEAFTRDVQEHRYDGYDRRKMIAVFDDCRPEGYVRDWLIAREIEYKET